MIFASDELVNMNLFLTNKLSQVRGYHLLILPVSSVEQLVSSPFYR